MNKLNRERTELAASHLKDFYENLNPEDIERFKEYYRLDARFRDPFNDVKGIDEIQRIFKHMFTQVHQPRFKITRSIIGEGEVILFWDFEFNLKILWWKRHQCIQGVSYLTFDQNGLIEMHRDYWDAAEELYSHLPIIGSLMRGLRRLMSA